MIRNKRKEEDYLIKKHKETLTNPNKKKKN